MPNPLFSQMSGQMPGPMGEMQQMMQQFQQFKASFRGDPRQEVQKLLNSEQMTQAQYNQIQQMAMQMSQMLGR